MAVVDRRVEAEVTVSVGSAAVLPGAEAADPEELGLGERRAWSDSACEGDAATWTCDLSSGDLAAQA